MSLYKIYIVGLNAITQIYDEQYKLISCLHIKSGHADHICLSKRGNIIVTKPNSVLVLTENGERIRKFGCHGWDDGEFSHADGICCNSLDEIIIADYGNDRIQIFNQQGEISTFI